MRRLTFLILAGVLALLAACDRAETTTTWDMSLPWSIREFHTTNAQRFAAEVQVATEGRLTIIVHPGAVLGIKGPQSLRAVAEGIVDMAEMPGFQQTGTEPILALESLPFLVADHDELAVLWRFLRPVVDRTFRDNGLKVLYVVPWPNQNLYTRGPIETIADLAGVKMRTQDKLTTDLMDRLGLVPVQMPSQDVVAALASGLIDATMTSTTTGAAQKYWEFTSVIHRTNHLWASNIMAINLETWNKLPPADQAIVAAIAKRLEPEFWAVSRADDLDKLAVLKANGMTVAEPSAELLAAMQQVSRKMWTEYMDATGPEAAQIVDRFLRETGKEPRS